MKKKKRHTLLKGEGIHQHTLYGDFAIGTGEFMPITAYKESLLKHEKPDKTKGEHETLLIRPGKYRMGKQVEFNPFDRSLSRVWD